MKSTLSLDNLIDLNKKSIVGHLGIELLEATDAHVTGRMPVDERTHQPFGILHGGASVVLAESLGSIASVLRLDDPATQRAVGLEINANHVRSVSSGWVYGKCTPIHIGRTTHIWDIRITDEQDRLVCISRLTIAIIAAK
ncbi:hotdog fold thioesterase [Fibrella aquatica]|jgi:1,4-dihydroxy-2-naphthoyl-CoA hydrolase|uniref:hotdog fold thioesterase n=1 Tax=Fibrella aquatica TaxID=3242487 RepID=UPI003521CA4F